MPRPTYDLIASTTLTSASTSITFSTIPTKYQDIKLVASIIGDGVGKANQIFFNSDTTGTNYKTTRVFSTYSVNTGDRVTNNGILGGWTTDGSKQDKVGYLIVADIFSYNNSSIKKSVIARVTDPAGRYYGMTVGFWTSTNAITNIEYRTASNMPIGSTVSIYGIEKA
jgi:hypothetical protein